MTNTLAFWLLLLIGCGIAADLVLNDGTALLFLGKKFFELLDWVAFWR
ncbi:glyceraldehyde-3-phosphate dehydrogenase [Pseudaestuariivita sp.]